MFCTETGQPAAEIPDESEAIALAGLSVLCWAWANGKEAKGTEGNGHTDMSRLGPLGLLPPSCCGFVPTPWVDVYQATAAGITMTLGSS